MQLRRTSRYLWLGLEQQPDSRRVTPVAGAAVWLRPSEAPQQQQAAVNLAAIHRGAQEPRMVWVALGVDPMQAPTH